MDFKLRAALQTMSGYGSPIPAIQTQIIPLGSHDLFIGEVVAVQIDEEVLNEKRRIDYRLCRRRVLEPG